MRKQFGLLWVPIKLIALSFIVSIAFIACEKEEPVDACNPSGVQGALVEAKLVITITPELVQAYLTQFGAPIGFDLEYTVDAYSVQYKTLDKNNEITPASGVMFIPRGLNTYDVVSVQHGTSLKRDEVGSKNPVYAFDALLYAMKGFLAVAPDYLGLGNSDMMHPYLNAQLSANAVMDLIRATRKYACTNDLALSEKLFLAGYSEGGYVTMAAHQIMETDHSDEFQLTGVAPMSGPYDLISTTRNLLQLETFNSPALLAFVVAAYDDVYEWNRLDDIFMEPYASMIPGMFDGSQSVGDLNDQLPTDLDSLFQSEFRTAFLQGEEQAIAAALQENTLLGWGPIAPVRLFHGTSDDIVAYENTTTAYASMLANGGLSVDLIPLLGATHATGFFPSLLLSEAWFDSLRAD